MSLLLSDKMTHREHSTRRYVNTIVTVYTEQLSVKLRTSKDRPFGIQEPRTLVTEVAMNVIGI